MKVAFHIEMQQEREFTIQSWLITVFIKISMRCTTKDDAICKSFKSYI